MKINVSWGDLTDIVAKTNPLVCSEFPSLYLRITGNALRGDVDIWGLRLRLRSVRTVRRIWCRKCREIGRAHV